jgi:hypothetical protein
LIRSDSLTTPSGDSGGGMTTAQTSRLKAGTSSSRISIPSNLAVLLPIDQTWLLKTYECGRLASSISLTAQEEMTVEIYSWHRKKTSQEDTSTFDSETSADSQGVDRDTKDVSER